MRLAEALILRADYQKRIEQLKSRILRNAKIQEGDDPAENPTILLAEMERIAQELARLIQRINKTNAVTLLQDEMTIALICRDSEGGKGGFAATMAGRHAPIESPAGGRGANILSRFRRSGR
jgi:hypothetical protein